MTCLSGHRNGVNVCMINGSAAVWVGYEIKRNVVDDCTCTEDDTF